MENENDHHGEHHGKRSSRALLQWEMLEVQAKDARDQA
jgi:hypothetical protein